MTHRTTRQIAAHYGVTRKTIREWARQGHLRAVRRRDGFSFPPESASTETAATEALTIKAAAAALEVSRETLYRWMRLGHVRYRRRPGGRRVVARAEIAAHRGRRARR